MAATIGIAAASLGAAGNQSDAQKAQGEAQKQMFEANQQFAELSAQDSLRRGEQAAQQMRKQGRQFMGAQRAAAAASGIEVDSGSAAELQADTAYMTEVDAMTIKNNAWREAWGYKVDAMNNRFSGQMAQIGAQAQAAGTLATGGINAATSMYQGYQYNKGPSTPSKSGSGSVTTAGNFSDTRNIS